MDLSQHCLMHSISWGHKNKSGHSYLYDGENWKYYRNNIMALDNASHCQEKSISIYADIQKCSLMDR